MATVVIETTPTSYRIRVTPSGYVIGTNVSIHQHCWAFNEREWDRQLGRFVVKKQYRHYDRKTNKLFLPRYDLDRFIKLLNDNGVPYFIRDVPLCYGKAVDIPIMPGFNPKSEIQAEAIDYCVNSPDPVRGIALQPGGGKTCVSLVSAARLGRRFMIKTPILLNQWKGAVQKWLPMPDEDIAILSGSGSVMRLLENIDKTVFPKAILASLQTLRDYANGNETYQFFPPFEEFMERLDVGTMIEDEVHMHFHSELVTDMILNPAVLIPMSATFEVTSKDVQPIFEGHFPAKIRFGEDRYKVYVDVSSYTYTLPISAIPKNQFRLFKGYSHVKFEDHLLHKMPILNKLFDDVYLPIIYADYINYKEEGEKLLIICSRTDMCAYMVKMLKREFPNLIVNMFVAGSKESIKQVSDIVVSTVKSSGVGFDMPNLITTLVTVAADSPPLNKQMLGRLRELKGRSPRLAYVSCLNIQSHVKYMATRRRIFPSLAKTFVQHALT